MIITSLLLHNWRSCAFGDAVQQTMVVPSASSNFPCSPTSLTSDPLNIPETLLSTWLLLNWKCSLFWSVSYVPRDAVRESQWISSSLLNILHLHV